MDIRTFKMDKADYILSDDYPVYDMYVYICDGVITRYTGFQKSTVGEWKKQQGYKVIRRFSFSAHSDALIGDKVEV
jgi:hypothetical protein